MIYAGFSRIGLEAACYNGLSLYAGAIEVWIYRCSRLEVVDSKKLERGLSIMYACFPALGL